MKRRHFGLLGAAVLVAGIGWVGATGASAQQGAAGARAATASRDWGGRVSASSVAEAEAVAAKARAARQGSAAAKAGQTLVVIEAPYSPPRDTFVDLAPRGDSVGDFFQAESRLLDRSGSQPVGQDAVRCELGHRTFTCAATGVIDGKGKIMVAGTLFAESDNVLAVVGGTGAYQGVGGELTVIDLPRNRTALIFHLVR